MQAIQSTIVMMVCLCLMTGCRSAGESVHADQQDDAAKQIAPYAFGADQRPAVHASAIEVLRDRGFEIERNDYRFGVITTKPKEAPTAAEFWIDDPTTPAQHSADTLNAHQRTVRVRVEKDKSRYTLTVEVLVERLQRPARYLTHSATGQLSAEYAATPTHLSDRGLDGPYAQMLTRDPHLERRLTDAIRQHAR